MNKIVYSFPGFFCVECNVTDVFFYWESEKVYQSLFKSLCQLQAGEFEDKDVQRNFNTYSEECFSFLPIV